jgi:hypothetical protein
MGGPRRQTRVYNPDAGATVLGQPSPARVFGGGERPRRGQAEGHELKTPNDDKGQPRVDFKNVDAKKRGRPALGHQLIMGSGPRSGYPRWA